MCLHNLVHIHNVHYTLHITHRTPTHTHTFMILHACIHTRMHTYTHAYIHAYTTYTYTHTYIHHVYDCMCFFVDITSILIICIYIHTYSLLILYIIIYDICIHTLWASCNAMIWWLRWDWGSTWIACPIAFVRNMWSDHCFSSAAGNLTSDNGF